MYDEFIRSLPKTEMHLHIEGALPQELLRKLDPVKYAVPPPSWDDSFRYPNFQAFDEHLLGMVCPWYTSPERYYEAAKLILERLYHEQNVRYVETSFASGVLEFMGVDGPATAEAIKAAAPEGLDVRVFLGIHHNGYNERTGAFIDDCVNWKHLDGVDLHGAETMPMEPWTDLVWKRFNDAGKMTKAHAGEFCGPEFVREVLSRLNVKRIEHGERAAQDPALLKQIKDLGITLDLCPISNVKLGVSNSFADHSLRKIFDAGVSCTINTDDPVCFGNTLFDDYEVMAREGGFKKSELLKIARNGFQAALVDEKRRAPWLAELDAIGATLGENE
ncbi:MAG: adenosine deaminase [Opitutales bacterium]|nr:adenosine deaminase [Opitutales bacterium]